MEQGIEHATPQSEKRLAYGSVVRKDLANQLGVTDKNAWTKDISVALVDPNIEEEKETEDVKLELRQEGDKIAVVRVTVVGYLNISGE